VSVELSALTPFTQYSVTVDCIPLVDDQVLGFWSDSISVLLTTKQDGSSHAASPNCSILAIAWLLVHAGLHLGLLGRMPVDRL